MRIYIRYFLRILALYFITAMPVMAITCPVPDTNDTAGQVIINEMSFHGNNSQDDWFEIYINYGSVNLDGWQVKLLGKGGINQTVDLPNVTFPWNNNSSGKFLIMASSTGDSTISTAISNGTLVQGTNLFIDSNVELHNTIQEMVLTDASGNLVYYLGYANNSGQLDYDCIDEYPDYADFIPDAGNDDNACTDVDGVSAGNQSGDWIAGCNGETTVGETNDPVASLSHYLIEHNASGSVDVAETITVKACLNSDCSSLLDEEITLEVYLTSGSGTFTSSSLTFSSGTATVDLTVSSSQTVQLGIRNDTPDGTYQCLDNNNSTSCDIVFSGGTPDHYELSYNAPACAGNDITLTVKACADASCTSTVNGSQSVDITYNDGSVNNIVSGLALSNGTGTYDWSLSSADTVTLALANISPAATSSYQCEASNGNTDCSITFNEFGLVIETEAGFEDQIAGAYYPFADIGKITATEGCSSVVSSDPLEVYIECDNPATCTSDSNYGFVIDGVDFDTEASGYADVVSDFDEENGYDLSDKLVFNDAGQITVTFRVGTATISETFYVRPAELMLMHNKADNTYQLAGQQFDIYVSGVGYDASNTPFILPNYSPGNLQADVNLDSAGNDSSFWFYEGADDSNNVEVQTGSGFVSVSDSISNFSAGSSTGMTASYDAAGTISVQVQDSNYRDRNIAIVSNILDDDPVNIQGDGFGSIGTFIPAYLDASQNLSLYDQCDSSSTDYSNVGQEFELTGSTFTVTAKNESGNDVANFDDDDTLWTLSVSQSNFSLVDNAGYTGTVAETLASAGVTEASQGDYDAIRTYELGDFTLNYEKSAALVAPFAASLNYVMADVYLPDGSSVRTFDTSTLDTTSSHQVCYQASYSSSHDCDTAHDFTYVMSGANMRYTRLALINSYGSEEEEITIPIRSQYWDGSQWLLNTDDGCSHYNSDDTRIDPATYTSVNTTGGDTLLIDGYAGTSSYDGFTLDTPDANYDENNAEVELQWNLDDQAYLMIDWDGNGVLCTLDDFGSSTGCDETDELDYPRATATFGRYRGNDRVIHWRETF